MASMKDIAERVGVSITTVSHALNRTRHVAPDTRRKIEEAIRELGFYKNVHARRLVRGRSDFLGLIVSDVGNPFFPEIIKSFESAALEHGFDLLLCNTNYEPCRTELAVRKMIENKVRGVAVMTSEFAPALSENLLAHHVPVVFLDVGPVQALTSNIRVDYSQGIFEAIGHLYELGHKEIAFIAGPQSLRSAVTRRKAFLDALQKMGLASHRTLEGNHKVDGGMTAVRSLLQQHPLPTAILCSNDLTAIGAMRALDGAGVKVPEAVSVFGFDDIDFAQMAHPPLTTISLPRDWLGTLAFQALHRLFAHKAAHGAEFVVETHLIKRHSTALVRQDEL
jgi:LacI family transcriptional regulator